MRPSLRLFVLLLLGLGLSGAGRAADRSSNTLQTERGAITLTDLHFTDVAGVQAWRVVDTASGAAFDLYADLASAKTARAAAPVLLAALRRNAESLGVQAGRVKWFDVQFTHHDAVSAALRAHERGAWRVPTEADGSLARGKGLQDGAWALRAMLPHEQAHAADAQLLRTGKDLPLWWIEGIATWAGNRALRNDGSRWAAQQRQHLLRSEAAELAAADGQIDLPAMKRSDQPRQEAILRQLSPAQRDTFLKTGQVPAIAMVFTDEDMEQSPHMGAHYIAAGRLFARVERVAGLPKMHAWFRAVAAEPEGALDSERIAALCLLHTGVDIKADLRNHSATR